MTVARWRPELPSAGGFRFGAADGVQFRIQALKVATIPFDLLLMLPHLVAIAALLLGIGRAPQQAALGRPYVGGTG